MKPIEFKEQNVVFAKDQPQYLPLPAHRFNDEEGTIVFCESVSKWEALVMLFTGKLWVTFQTYYNPVQPSFFSVKKSDVMVVTEQRTPSKIKMALYNVAKWCKRKITETDQVYLVFFALMLAMITIMYFLSF